MGRKKVNFLVSDNGIENQSLPPLERRPALSGATKAAKFLLALGPEGAAKVLRELDVSDIEKLVNEMAGIRQITSDEKKEILAQFTEKIDEKDDTPVWGEEGTRKILIRSLGAEKAEEIMLKIGRRDLEKDFQFLEQVDPNHLAAALSSEHPQVAAVTLSFIRPKIAALLLQQFEPDFRLEVARRIAQTSRTHPDAIYQVVHVLREKFEKRKNDTYSDTGGTETLANILNHLDRETEDKIMETLDSTEPELFQEVKELLYTFEELTNLDVREMRQLLARVDDDYLLASSLRGAGEDLRRHFFNALSQNRAADILEEMELRGPLSIREINEARNYILSVARKMDESSEILIKKDKEDYI